MSVVPLYLRMLDELTPSSVFNQDFGLDNLVIPRLILNSPRYRRPWTLNQNCGTSNIVNNKDEFKVNLDVQQFKPEEISVKIADKHVVIDGKHEERQDEHGYISRTFKRRYMLPDDVDPKAVMSSLSSDGVLRVSAPKKRKLLPENERKIPIVQTHRPSIKETLRKKSDNESVANGETMEQ